MRLDVIAFYSVKRLIFFWKFGALYDRLFDRFLAAFEFIDNESKHLSFAFGIHGFPAEMHVIHLDCELIGLLAYRDFSVCASGAKSGSSIYGIAN